jgi:hypothetical protein
MYKETNQSHNQAQSNPVTLPSPPLPPCRKENKRKETPSLLCCAYTYHLIITKSGKSEFYYLFSSFPLQPSPPSIYKASKSGGPKRHAKIGVDSLRTLRRMSLPCFRPTTVHDARPQPTAARNRFLHPTGRKGSLMLSIIADSRLSMRHLSYLTISRDAHSYHDLRSVLTLVP